ncbi:hypothetical protein [Actinoplanes sp. TFC3]|uniref:hypothetical protein n=1 Tax=Actinoplanes sp. TFC3 TaxID=1710355 RepID=UPI00137A37EB|nr:hypothetical protein [Actinoplanes sp. TFC3]
MPDAIENVVLGPRVVQIIAGFSLVVAVVGAFFAWRGIAGAKRLITTLALSAAAGSTVALGIFFILSDGLAPFAVLMAQSALSIAMICRAALKSSSKEGRR